MDLIPMQGWEGYQDIGASGYWDIRILGYWDMTGKSEEKGKTQGIT